VWQQGIIAMSSVTSLENKTWSVYLETDPKTGDLILPLTDEMTAGLGWEVGDTLKWIDNQDGTWTIKKVVNPLTFIKKYLIILGNKFARSKNE
jgi:hypothetical protein